MSEGVRERTTRSAPCIFCGDVGYDIRMHYPAKEEVVHWCHKTNAAKGDQISVGADVYECIAAGRENGIGVFDLFKKRLTKEEWMAKQERINPDWKPYSKGKTFSPKEQKHVIPVSQVCVSRTSGNIRLVDEEEKLPHEKLDKVYRAMLGMLVLEDKHKTALLKEWKSPVYDVTCLLTDYPIRSLPPVDQARYANGETFKNPTRKYIVSRLLSMFGDLRGIPGFYLRSGSYWDTKPEKERWTFTSLEGMVFPCFDEHGFLYSIRIRDDYPDRVIKEGKAEPFNGMYGTFHHFYDKDGKHCWMFQDKEGKNPVLYGVKPYGKVNGKYKCFSSVHEKLVDGKSVNTMKGGSSSGTPYSLYDKYCSGYTVMFATEGEKKGMVANAVKRMPVVEVAGVGSYRVLFEKGENGMSFIDTMKARGMKCMIVCYDADKEDNAAVKKAEAGFVAELKKHGVDVRIGYWKKDFDKGLDDILLSGVDILIGPA